MIIDKTKITGTRFMFSIAFFLQSSALLTAYIAGVLNSEAWIPVIIGMILSIPIAFMFSSIMALFPDKNLFQIFESVFGKALGKVMSVLMLWFYLQLGALNVMDLSDIMKLTFLHFTPSNVITLSCLMIVAWAVRNGFGVVSRYSSMFTVIEYVILGTSIILLINQMDITNLLPVFSQPLMKYVQSVHIVTIIPISEIVVFLMVTPCVEPIGKKKAFKIWVLGTLMGVSVLLMTLVRDIAILGNALSIFSLPGLVTLRLVNLGEAISRMEIIFSIAVIMLLFFKITVIIYAAAVGLSTIFETKDFKNMALITAIFIYVYAPTLYENNVEHGMSAHAFEPFVNALFEIVIPLLTLLLAKIRGLPKSKDYVATANAEG